MLSPDVSEYKTVLDSGFRVLDYSLFQWNLDSRFYSLVGYLSSIYSGFQSPAFRIPWAKFSPIPDPTSKNFPDSRIWIPLHGAKYFSNIVGPVHPYLIKQWKIYFSSNVRFYNMINRSNFWSMQLFQTGPHFKLEEVWFWKGIFPSWHNRLNTNVRGSGKLNEAWKGIFYLLN